MLIEDYSQAMMSALFFMNAPRSVLLIGLGGCSCINFLLKAFPQCAIDTVEIRRSVIDLARKFFILQGEHIHLKIFHDAGQDFIYRCKESGGYDLILIDAFDEDGLAAPLLKKDFIAACRARLNGSGVFAMNVWNRPRDNFPALYVSVREIFESHTLKLPLGEAYRNVIIFGFGERLPNLNLLEYRSLAESLQREHRINFPKFLRYLHWQNSREQ
jgi:spermidine synthase